MFERSAPYDLLVIREVYHCASASQNALAHKTNEHMVSPDSSGLLWGDLTV